MNAIDIHHITKRFGDFYAVRDLSLSIPRGGVYGLLGPNGAGKTTTLRILAGLLRPGKGSVRVLGLDPGTSHARIASRVGMMIEGPGLHPNLSARRNLDLFGRLKGLGKSARKNEVAKALDFADLGDGAGRPVKGYSSGMRQKTALALAFMGSPDLIVLDEPTSGLDPASVVRLRETIRDLRRSRGTTFLLSSHHLAEMETLCSTVAIIAFGRVLAAGNPDALRPKGPAVHRLRVSDGERAAACASSLEGVSVIRAGPSEMAVEANPDAVPVLVRALLEASVEVSEVRPARSRLEEAYMEWTREGGKGPR